MGRWRDETMWVNDADGVRWYFSERDPGGPSSLECYRRLLAGPEAKRGSDVAFGITAPPASLRRCMSMLELTIRGWRASLETSIR